MNDSSLEVYEEARAYNEGRAATMNITVSVINATTVLSTDKDLAPLAAALEVQKTHLAEAYPEAAAVSVELVRDGDKPSPGAWWLVFLDNSDVAQALGYHDLTSEGLPISKAFAKTCMEDGTSWTVDGSHEFGEMIADPFLNAAIYDPSRDAFVANEICDPCEDDSQGYKIGDVLVSNFVFPSYFQTMWAAQPVQPKYDYLGLITSPLQILNGGYLSVYHDGIGWQQVTSPGILGARHAARKIPRVGSRRERRRRGPSTWLRSTAHPRVAA